MLIVTVDTIADILQYNYEYYFYFYLIFLCLEANLKQHSSSHLSCSQVAITSMFKSWGSVRFSREINSFIHQSCIKLIKSDKVEYITTKHKSIILYNIFYYI